MLGRPGLSVRKLLETVRAERAVAFLALMPSQTAKHPARPSATYTRNHGGTSPLSTRPATPERQPRPRVLWKHVGVQRQNSRSNVSGSLQVVGGACCSSLPFLTHQAELQMWSGVRRSAGLAPTRGPGHLTPARCAFGAVVVRHEESDSRLYSVREHAAHELDATGASQLDGFEDGGPSVHAPGHTWRRATAPAPTVMLGFLPDGGCRNRRVDRPGGGRRAPLLVQAGGTTRCSRRAAQGR